MKFSAQVDAWARKCGKRTLAVVRAAGQSVVHEASIPVKQGGNMPVKDSFLRNSIAANLSGMPAKGDPAPELVLLRMQLGGKIWIGWVSAYARRMEYGFVGEDSLGRYYSQAGYGFMRKAAQQWQPFVNQAVAEVKAQYP